MPNDEELVVQILSEVNPETLDILCYFNKKDASDNYRKVFLSELSKHYRQIEPLISLGLVEEFPPTKSVLFLKDKLDDFIFRDDYSDYSKSLVEETKEVFKVIIRYSNKIPNARRVSDEDGKIRNFILEMLKKIYDQLKQMRPVEAESEKDYFKIMKECNAYKEFGPAKCYRITAVGDLIRQEIIRKKSQEKIPEEQEFEDLLKRLNIFDVPNA